MISISLSARFCAVRARPRAPQIERERCARVSHSDQASERDVCLFFKAQNLQLSWVSCLRTVRAIGFKTFQIKRSFYRFVWFCVFFANRSSVFRNIKWNFVIETKSHQFKTTLDRLLGAWSVQLFRRPIIAITFFGFVFGCFLCCCCCCCRIFDNEHFLVLCHTPLLIWSQCAPISILLIAEQSACARTHIHNKNAHK